MKMIRSQWIKELNIWKIRMISSIAKLMRFSNKWEYLRTNMICWSSRIRLWRIRLMIIRILWKKRIWNYSNMGRNKECIKKRLVILNNKLTRSNNIWKPKKRRLSDLEIKIENLLQKMCNFKKTSSSMTLNRSVLFHKTITKRLKL